MSLDEPVPPFIGPYPVLGLIIETVHAFIYESHSPERCEKLAIKCIKKDPSVNALCWVEDECSIMYEICDDNCMRVIDVFDLPAYRCIVMPLATGGDLYEYIERNGMMPEEAASQVIHGALQGLRYLHSSGIWHRDIKPENILFVDESLVDPRVVLCDFGFAKHFTEGEMSTEFVGTPFYAAPEVHLKHPCMFAFLTPDDRSVDMWALGVTMFLLLSGEGPWPSGAGMMEAIVKGGASFETEAWDEVSPEAKDLIALMLVNDPAHRITAEEAINHPWFVTKFPDRNKPTLVRATATSLGIAAFELESEADDILQGEGVEQFDGL
jgi:serine/threonine protein kinase